METTASIIAVAQLCEKVVKYIIAVSGAKHEKQRLRSQIRSCSNLLLQLQDEAEDSEEAEEWTKTLKLLSTPLVRLHEALSLAAAALSARDGVAEKLRWPLKEKDVEKLIEAIKCEMDMVTFALQNNSTSLLIEINAGSKRNEQHLVDVKAALGSNIEKTQSGLRDLNGVRERVEDLHERHDTEEAMQKRQHILDWLTSIDHAAQQRDAISTRQAGTGEWLLHSQAYQNWLETCGCTLFCPGIPGAGKTVFASIINADLWERYREDDTVGLAYVFCNYKSQREQTLENLLASLLKQLVARKTPLPEVVQNLYDCAENVKDGPAKFDRVSAITDALSSVVALYPKVFIVLDALDECSTVDHCRAKLLSTTNSLRVRDEGNINLLATSRYIPEISERFKTAETLSIQADNSDVRVYLMNNMFRLPNFVQKSSELQKELIARVVDAVRGMFLLAKLHLDSLTGKKSVKALRNALKQLATGSDAYDHAYEAAMQRIEGQVVDQADLAKQTLAFLSCARTRLRARDLQEALGVEIGETQLDPENFSDLEDIVAACLGLVTVELDSGIIRLVHYTTQEYLARTQQRWFPKAHDMIIDICATYLAFDEFSRSSEYYVDRFGTFTLETEGLYGYAARYWSHHAKLAPAGHEQVSRFLNMPLNVLVLHLNCWPDQYRSVLGMKKVRLGEDVTTMKLFGRQGIHLAAQHGLNTPLTALLDIQESPDIVDIYPDMSTHERGDGPFDRVTPLLVAAKYQQKDTMEILLRYNVDVNFFSEDGNSALLYATHHDDIEIVRLLTRHGANWERQNAACMAESIHASSQSQWLAASPGDIHKMRLTRGTPLLVAAVRGNKAIVELFVSADGNYKISSSDAGAALIVAAWYGHLPVVEVLLVADAKTRGQGSIKRTSTVCPVTKARCDSDTCSKAGFSFGLHIEESEKNDALMFAATRGKDDIARILLDNVTRGKIQNESGSAAPTKVGSIKIPPFNLTVHGFGKKTDTTDEHGHTIVSRAAAEGWTFLVELLITHGADVNYHKPPHHSPLTEAVKRWSRLRQTARPYRNLPLEPPDYLSEWPNCPNFPYLGEAAKHCVKAINYLLSLGARVTPVDSNEWLEATIRVVPHEDTPHTIVLVISTGDQSAIELSIRPDALINFQSVNSPSTLLDMESRYWPIVAQHLINCGADINTATKKGHTPLHLACRQGNSRLVALYIDNHANIEARDENNRTPLFEACSSSLLDLQIIKLLLEHGADVRKQDSRGKTALVLIDPEMDQGLEAATLLLKAGADVNHRDREGRTPLFFAARRHAVEFVAMYLRHCANAIARNKAGQTALTIVLGQQAPQKGSLRRRYDEVLRHLSFRTRSMSI